MSVETARERVLEKSYSVYGPDGIERDLDQLVVEVQAAMPCYLLVAIVGNHTVVDGTALGGTRCPVKGQYCPSCEARAKLEVQ